MIIEILMLVAAAIIFVVLARRYPATEVEPPAHVRNAPSAQRSTGANRTITRAKYIMGRLTDSVVASLSHIFDFISKLRFPKRSKRAGRNIEIAPEKPLIMPPVDQESPPTDLQPKAAVHQTPTVVIDEAIDALSVEGERLLANADEQFKQKNWEKAEQLYVKAVLHLPKEPKIYSRLGVIYLEKKNYHDAKEAFSTAIQYDDGVASRYYNLALAFAGLGDRRKALVSVKKALDLDSGNEKYIRLMEKLVA